MILDTKPALLGTWVVVKALGETFRVRRLEDYNPNEYEPDEQAHDMYVHQNTVKPWS